MRWLAVLVFQLCWLLPVDSVLGIEKELLYVEDRAGNDVWVIDLATNEVINRIKVGKYPNGVVANKSGDRVYVSVGEPPSIVAVDTATDEVLWRTAVTSQPHLAAVAVGGRYVFAPIFMDNIVEVIDTQKQTVIDKIELDLLGLHYAYASEDGNRVYIVAMYGERVAVIDALGRTVERLVPTDGMVRPIAVTNDEKTLYAAISTLHGVKVIDLETDERIATLHLPMPPPDSEPLTWPYTATHGICLSPDNQYLVVSSNPGGYAGLFTVPEHKYLGKVKVGKFPNWIDWSSDGKRFYVSNARSGSVSVVSFEKREEIARIPVGKQPQHLLTVKVPNRVRPQ